jgi:hypothetical protein
MAILAAQVIPHENIWFAEQQVGLLRVVNSENTDDFHRHMKES